jgi:broad specificity phosphatase PhoE
MGCGTSKDEEFKDGFDTFLVRHGYSKYNEAQDEIQKIRPKPKDKEFWEDPEVKFDQKLIDCYLTEKGIEQAKKGETDFSKKNIKMVLCSPLKRCIITALTIFKNHKDKPKILLHPLLREAQLSACDVASPLDELIKEFKDEKQVDFTIINKMLKPQIWFTDQYEDENVRRLIVDYVDTLPSKGTTVEDGKKVQKFILENMKSSGKKLESYLHVKNRANKFKLEFKDIVYERDLHIGDVCLVSHFMFLMFLTASKFNQKPFPLDGTQLENAKISFFEFY